MSPSLHRRWDRTTDPAGAAGAPLVLINSLGTDLHLWDPVMAQLTAHHDVLRFDVRGHGRSEDSGTAFGIDDLTGDVLRVFDEEGVDTAHVVGISLGGMTALRLAQLHPRRVASIVPSCCAADTSAQEWADRARLVRERGLAEISNTVIGRWLTEEARANRPSLVMHYRSMLLANDPTGYALACDALAQADLRPGLAAISAPTMVVSGAHDVATPPAKQREIAEAIPAAELAILGGSAHIPVAETAPEFAATILRHIDAVEQPGIKAPCPTLSNKFSRLTFD